MWFMDQFGQFINSDKLEAMRVGFDHEENGEEVWNVRAERNGYEEVLYRGNGRDCREWLYQLVIMINSN